MKAAIASRLIPWFQNCLIDRNAEWYKTNEYFRYKKGDKIKLRSEASAGFGIDPKGIVIDCVTEKNVFGEDEDFYIIEMDCYDYNYHKKKGDAVTWNEWFMGKRIQKDHRRIVKRQRHSKWNIEYHFKKVK